MGSLLVNILVVIVLQKTRKNSLFKDLAFILILFSLFNLIISQEKENNKFPNTLIIELDHNDSYNNDSFKWEPAL